MLRVYPDYYKDFRCINRACKHNCCIGWEIDIDDETAEYYTTVGGEMGCRLSDNISREGDVHFILGEDGRCPLLNSDNLCDIITELGEDSLCTICAEHPRFHNELPGRIESGVGLCCEAAAKLILTKRTPTVLVVSDEVGGSDEIIDARDEIIHILQNRDKSIPQRIDEMLRYCGLEADTKSIAEWAEFFLSLERLDGEWTDLLEMLRDNAHLADLNGFDRYMSGRESEWEQLLVYFIYRHFACAPDKDEAALRAAFAALSYKMIYSISATEWSLTGKADVVNTARLYSSEVEYSTDNMDATLDELYFK